MPELTSLRSRPQKQKCRASVLQYLPLNSGERQPAVARWLFEPAEHRQAQHETDSELSRCLLGPEFQAEQSGSSVAMPQRREVMPKCFEALELLRLAHLPLVKNPAHQRKPQLALAL